MPVTPQAGSFPSAEVGIAPHDLASQHAVAAKSYSALWGANGEGWTPTGRLIDYSFAGYHAGESPLPTTFATSRNVKDFGATGNGKTDDTAAILKALAAVKAASTEGPSRTSHRTTASPSTGSPEREVTVTLSPSAANRRRAVCINRSRASPVAVLGTRNTLHLPRISR